MAKELPEGKRERERDKVERCSKRARRGRKIEEKEGQKWCAGEESRKMALVSGSGYGADAYAACCCFLLLTCWKETGETAWPWSGQSWARRSNWKPVCWLEVEEEEEEEELLEA